MKLQKIYRNENHNQSFFVVDWMLHDRCTYDCSYCPPGNKQGIDTWLNLSTLKDFCDELEKHAANVDPNTKILANFSGGEPTVWKHFPELLDALTQRGWLISISTNGSRSINWWKENAHKLTRINLSYHTESVVDDEFLEKVRVCEEYSQTSVNIMLNPDPKFFGKAVNFNKRVLAETAKAGVHNHQIQHNFGMQTIMVPYYTKVQKEIMATLPDRYPAVHPDQVHIRHNYFHSTIYGVNKSTDGSTLIDKQLVNFENWICSAGIEGVFVDSAGRVSRGTCRMGGELGNIQEPNKINWPTTPVLCKKDWCGCITDILKSKHDTKKFTLTERIKDFIMDVKNGR